MQLFTSPVRSPVVEFGGVEALLREIVENQKVQTELLRRLLERKENENLDEEDNVVENVEEDEEFDDSKGVEVEVNVEGDEAGVKVTKEVNVEGDVAEKNEVVVEGVEGDVVEKNEVPVEGVEGGVDEKSKVVVEGVEGDVAEKHEVVVGEGDDGDAGEEDRDLIENIYSSGDGSEDDGRYEIRMKGRDDTIDSIALSVMGRDDRKPKRKSPDFVTPTSSIVQEKKKKKKKEAKPKEQANF